MKAKELPSQERLKELFDYEPETGKFERKNGRKLRPIVIGYRYKKIDGIIYSTHRLIWRFVTGEDPLELKVDHRDRNPSNNAWSNLRIGTTKQNGENRGAKGFGWCKQHGKWKAQIQHHGKSIHIGYFDCAMCAHLAYVDKKKELHSWGY